MKSWCVNSIFQSPVNHLDFSPNNYTISFSIICLLHKNLITRKIKWSNFTTKRGKSALTLPYCMIFVKRSFCVNRRDKYWLISTQQLICNLKLSIGFLMPHFLMMFDFWGHVNPRCCIIPNQRWEWDYLEVKKLTKLFNRQ